MKRVLLLLTLACLGLLLCTSVFGGEVYTGESFPPESVISNAVRFYNGSLGKILDKNGVYHYFYKEGTVARKALVYKLDTGIWVVEEEGEFTIVEKDDFR